MMWVYKYTQNAHRGIRACDYCTTICTSVPGKSLSEKAGKLFSQEAGQSMTRPLTLKDLTTFGKFQQILPDIAAIITAFERNRFGCRKRTVECFLNRIAE